jgi:hypothetical protein
MILNIDPKVDFAFKHLFGKESTRTILIDLLNQVLSPGPGYQIQEVELMNCRKHSIAQSYCVLWRY